MKFCDAHCHLQNPVFDTCREEIIARAFSAGVFRFVVCGTNPGDWGSVAGLAGKYESSIVASYGLHPWFVNEDSLNHMKELRNLIEQNTRAGVGEIGLDLCEGRPAKGLQEKMFREQLSIAIEFKRPVSLHCVKAWGPFVAILKEFGEFDAGGLVHAFSGSAESMRELDELGLSFSFGCGVVNSYNTRARDALKRCPTDRLLFESDAPALPGFVKAESEPADVVEVAKVAAEIRGVVDLEQFVEQVRENGDKIFG